MANVTENITTKSKRKKFLSFLAGGAAAALVGGSLVVAGITADPAAAAPPPPPTVSVDSVQTHVLGEDLFVDVSVANLAGTSAVYNLSATLLLPDTVEIVDTGALGTYVTYESGDTLPGSAVGEDCSDLGLDGDGSGPCAVPEGMQLVVFQNFSDLPATASVNTTLRLRPAVDKADTGQLTNGFAVGDDIDVVFNAYTSSDERLIPMFPGSTTVGGAGAAGATSQRGNDELSSEVNALRITKSEPSPENELLRGVHDNATIYTLTIHHTGEGNLSDAVVVDYLPAGLEYLGSCTLEDNTSNAGNGSGAAEYTESGRLNAGATAPDNCLDESSVETVELDSDQAAELGLARAGVYTKVTWNVGEWLATSNKDAASESPAAQPENLEDAGFPASTVIRYRAGIPLFENTRDFGGDTPATDGAQGANLDNNNGPSTRHGSETADGANDADAWTNAAIAQGTWRGIGGQLDAVTAEDSDTEVVDAVDVRVLKDVRIGDDWSSTATFEQGSIADYRLLIHTSEYVGAELGDDPSMYLIDQLANGLCPVYPSDVEWADGPNFVLDGNPVTGADDAAIIAAWNAALASDQLHECAFEDSNSDATFSGALLKSVEFDRSTGRFSQHFLLDDDSETALAGPNGEVAIIYAVHQNSSYLTTGAENGEDGATSSGDTVQNTVKIQAKTTPIPATEDIPGVGSDYYAWDDSEATVTTDYSGISKHVLRNDPDEFGDISGADVADLDYGTGAITDPAHEDYPWTKKEQRPFGVGDEVWFKIHWESAHGADVRNPVISDFLPEGVAFDPNGIDVDNPWLASDNLHIAATTNGQRLPSAPGAENVELGVCTFDLTNPEDVDSGFHKFVGDVILDDETNPRKLTWELGSADCYPTEEGNQHPSHSPDRFWPGGIDLSIYIKVTVTDAQAFGSVDIAQNLVKYEQMNVDGDIFFLRDQAEITPDMTARLIKGIADNQHPDGTKNNSVNTNVDGEQVVQDNQVTFRLDVTAPTVSTTGYQIWDALPEGILAADVDETSFTAAPWEGSTTGAAWSAPGDFEAYVYDWADVPPEVRNDIHTDYTGRTIVIWDVKANVPASTPVIGDDPAVQRGVTLGYTIEIPGSAEGDRAAQLAREYYNTASIAQYTIINNGQGASGDGTTIVVSAPETGGVTNGGDTVTGSSDPSVPVSARTADDVPGSVPVPADYMTDPSDVYLPGAEMSKILLKTEVGPDNGPAIPGADHDLGSNNPDNSITQGEYATFEYQVTIPAKTSVSGAVLSDRGDFRRGNTVVPYEIVPDLTKFYQGATGTTDIVLGTETHQFRGDALTGELTFPELYHNVTNEPQVFRVQITVWVKDRDGTDFNDLDNYNPVLNHGQTLNNVATFEYDNPNASSGTTSISDDANVRYIEPAPAISKTADPGSDVSVGKEVTFTLEASNATGRPTAFDSVVYDCVPAGLIEVTVIDDSVTQGSATVQANECSIEDGAIDLAGTSGTLITWSVGDVNAGSPQMLQYTATIDPTTGAGESYTNVTEITGYTLPSTIVGESTTDRRGDRIDNDSVTVTAITADITKGVKLASDTDGEFEEAVSAPIGDTVKYEIDVTLNANINYYDVVFTDTLQEGLEIDQSTIEIRMTSGTDPPYERDLSNDWTLNTSGQTNTWTYDQSDGHFRSVEHDRTLTFTYEVLLADDAVPNSVAELENTAGFSWAQTPDGTPRDPITDDAMVNVLNPTLGIAKKVDGKDSETYNPDATFEYTLQVTNRGATDAYHVTIVDEVPTNVVVDPATISSVQGVAGVLTDQTATGGGTITWANIPGPLAVYTNGTDSAETIDLSYSAKFVDSAGLTRDTRTNTANVTHFESFEDGGRNYDPPLEGSGSIRDTAEVRPIFPYVELDKAVSEPVDGEEYGVVNVGESLNWTLTLTNTGEGTAQTIVATDELPENWEYVADSARVKIGNNPIALIEPEEDGQTLTWGLGTDTGPGVLPGTIEAPGVSGLPSRTITITFDARPLTGALDYAGTGIEIHAHTNTLSAVTTDTTGYEDEDYTGPGDDATAYIPEADLVMEKTTVPTAAVPAGTPNVHAWNLVVTNEGPDTAEGPITVTDTTSALPEGITVTRASGEGWTCDVPNRAADGTTTFECARDADESLALGESFPTIEVWVNIASDQLATTVSNTATVVPGKTFDPEDDNNEDDDELTTTTEADLAIAKNISGPVAPDVVTAGGPITWEITAQNIGPSDSLSTTDNPITITDTVPAGVQNVSATANASWSVAASNGFPAKSGDVITWTYLGDRITAGAFVSSVSLAGTILSSQTDAITNAAVVHPGVTPDPNYVEDPSDSDYPEQNNYDEVTTTTPVVAATLSIDKVRVVPDGSGGFRLADPQNRNDDIVAGDSVFYQITVTNNGPSDAIGVEVVDETPAGLTYADHVNVVGTWQHADGGITSAFPEGAKDGRIFGTFTLQSDQAPGEDNATRFIVEYDTIETLDPVEVVHNWAEVTSDNWDPNDPGDPWDRDDDRSNSSRIVDLGVTKSHTGSGPFTPGTAVEYTIEVTNNGPSATPGPVTIEDSLPAGMAYVAGSASITMPTGLVAPLETEPALRGTENRVLEWVLVGANELFASDTQITITYDATIHENVREAVELENVVTVDGEEPDGDPTNNRDTDKITTGPTSATVGLVKEVQANDGSWLPITAKTAGTSATWRVTITNEGPSAAPVTFTDEMPVGITLTGISGTGWDCDVNEASCEYTANNGLHPVGSSVLTMTSDIDAQVPPTPAPGLVNWGEITWTDGSSDDPTEKTARDDAAVTTERVADLGIVKQALNPADGDIATEVVAGEELWYTLELTNHGPSAAVGPLVVNDLLPEGVNVVRLTGSSASAWDVSVDSDAPHEVTFTRSDATVGLAVGESTTIRILASVDPDVVAGTELVNTATIDESTLVPNNDPNEENDRDGAEVNTVRESHLTVDKGHIAAEPDDEFEVGKDVTFTISVTNEGGPSNASGIVVTDTLPVGLEYDSIAGDGWVLDSATENADGTTTVVASYAGEVAPDASTTELRVIATVTAAIGDGPEVTNDVCITGVGTHQTNTNTEACDDNTITVVPIADLFVLKTAATPEADIAAGLPVTWNITVGNNGPSDSVSSASNRITVTDTIPEGIHSVADPSLTDSQGDWTALLNGEAWTGTVAAGDTITWVFQGERIPAASTEFVVLKLTGTIDAAWIDGEEIVNTAKVTPGETRDPEKPNNEDDSTVTPGNDTSLRITKTRVVDVNGEWVTAPDEEPFNAGEDITYRITVINNGPAVARDVQVVDETPEGLVYESFDNEVGEWSATTGGSSTEGDDPSWVTFTLAETQPVGVDNYRSFIVTFSSDPALGDPTNVQNWAEVTAENWPDGHDRDDDTAVSKSSADLSIAKSHSVPAAGEAVVAGETVSYELVITNEGSSVSDAPIVVTDTLPDGFSYIEGSGSIEPVVDGQVLTWDDITAGETLERGATVTVTYEVLVDSSLVPAEDVRNVAVVDGPNDENPLNDRDDDLVNITGVADLALEKVVVTDEDEITAGETVTWSITPRNEGPSVSLSSEDNPITVTDVIPDGISALVNDPSNADWQATTSNAGGWSQATAGDTITWTFLGDRIQVGDAPAIEVTGLIDPAWIGGDEITNVAQVNPGDTPEPPESEDPTPNDDTSTIVPGDRTVIDIAKNRVVLVEGEWVHAASLDPVPTLTPGETVSYRIDVVNEGPAIARNVTVIDPIPVGLSDPRIVLLDGFGEWTGDTATCEDGVTDLAGYPAEACFTASLTGPLGLGVSEARSFIVTFDTDPAIDVEEELVNWAQARAENVPEDERPEDEDSTENRAISDLSIVKTAAQELVLAGSTVDYELVVTNEGPSIARGPITITDQLPLGMGYVAETTLVSVASADPVAIEPTVEESQGSELLTWTLLEDDHLDPGATIVVTLQGVTAVDRIAPDGLTNVATVAAYDDTNPLNNESNATVIVDPVVTLIVEKTASEAFQVGSTGTYEITVTNAGPTVDPGPITVTDELPAGLTFESSDDDTFQVDGDTVTWTIDAGLQIGETHRIELVVNVGEAAYPEVTNIVTVDSPAEKTPESILEDDATVPVKAAPPIPQTGGTLGLTFILAGMLLLAGAGVLVLGNRRRETAQVNA